MVRYTAYAFTYVFKIHNFRSGEYITRKTSKNIESVASSSVKTFTNTFKNDSSAQTQKWGLSRIGLPVKKSDGPRLVGGLSLISTEQQISRKKKKKQIEVRKQPLNLINTRFIHIYHKWYITYTL